MATTYSIVDMAKVLYAIMHHGECERRDESAPFNLTISEYEDSLKSTRTYMSILVVSWISKMSASTVHRTCLRVGASNAS